MPLQVHMYMVAEWVKSVILQLQVALWALIVMYMIALWVLIVMYMASLRTLVLMYVVPEKLLQE